jgi:hypothetical protein
MEKRELMSTVLLRPCLEQRGILPVDMELEFGRHHGQGRQDLGGVEEACHEVHHRICVV